MFDIFLRLHDSISLGAVSNLWIECLDGIVGLLVWRDAEVKRYETNHPYLYSVPGNAWLNSELSRWNTDTAH